MDIEFTSFHLMYMHALCMSQGGVLRYNSDGEVRSPFLGLKLVIWDFF